MSHVQPAAAGTAGPHGKQRSKWIAISQWRNWTLPVKLGVVLIVPVLGALVLGVLRVRDDVALADTYADTARIATLRSELVPMLSVIQKERNVAVQTPGDSPEFQQQIKETDNLIARLDGQVKAIPDLDPTAATGYRRLAVTLGALKPARAAVARGADPSVRLFAYETAVSGLLDFDRSLVGQFPDATLTGLSQSLWDLQAAREQVALQHAIGLVGIRRGVVLELERDQFLQSRLRLTDRLDDARTVAPADLWRHYEATVRGKDVTFRQELVFRALGRNVATMPFSAEEWNTASNATTQLMDKVAKDAAGRLLAESSQLQDSIGNRAGTQSVLLLAMVLLAGGIGLVVGRYLLQSVSVLRRTALDVANNRLPAAVASIRAGRPAEAAIEPVPLRTTEEFGQLARAFDAVNGQAVRSATEEAALRSNLRNIFVNLSRRSQGLVERQLKLMEQLEAKENDPDQLSNLFRLDHLATRMRRNNENLMVLSGLDLGRRVTEPMALPDVLRAAVSEIEHYQRAVVRSAPMVRIVGYAAGDLIRTVAELVENATVFSPPDTPVIITSALQENGAILIDVLDQGIGMGEAELRDANQRVAAAGDVDVPVSRQMGLFVVGSLTNRHRIRVRLNRRPEHEGGGLRASLFVPAELVAREGEPAPAPAPARPERPAMPMPLPAPEPMPIPEPVGAGVGGGGVIGKLESAGIFVRLPVLPSASSPASILFAARIPVEETTQTRLAVPPRPAEAPQPPPGFSWLGASAQAQDSAPTPQPQPRSAPTVAQGPDGLPKRVPQAQLLAPQPKRRADNPAPPVPQRDAAKARGFLSNFQSGIQHRQDNAEGNT
ncbi:nitrate- and nitrite sensing domain-containing protein [Actinophytocola sp.]|uniref:sensor histidine kinase n=1 Tax=Actinophytocola sp. TaxID=1872138 RepID=UPI002D7F9AAB|nr:nitrate- and nitrite sensing domain-containing protein [Actinophytocola sp.]HET9143964.1 nitrate- and nitrite sensing domain-containing protein [Actinophytocola sp.]